MIKARQHTKQHDDAESVSRGSDNVFADLGFPDKEAAALKVKAELTLQIHQRIKQLGLTQVRAAERLGLSQPDASKAHGWPPHRLFCGANAHTAERSGA